MANRNEDGDAGEGAERRVAARRELSMQAEAGFGDDEAAQSCWLRDISDTGARLELEDGTPVPAHFTLRVGDEVFTCEKVWQGPLFAGVQFEKNEYVRELLGRIYELFQEADGNVGAIVSLSQAARNGAFGSLNLPGLTGRLDQVAADGRALIESMDDLVRDFGEDRITLLPPRDGASEAEDRD
jgi:hypothetical protein